MSSSSVNQSENLLAVALAAFAARGETVPPGVRFIASSQSDCVIVEREFGETVVAKIFRRRPQNEEVETARLEFEALQKFALESMDDNRYITPVPLQFQAAPPSYLMTYCPGVPLTKALNGVDVSDAVIEELARTILGGLRAFHHATGQPYGDFHPDNVLFDGVMPAFIDPGSPNPAYAIFSQGYASSPIVGDLGYWLFSLAGKFKWDLPRLLFRARPVVRLTTALVAGAAAVDPDMPPAVFVDAVFSVAQEYARRYLPGAGVRRRAHQGLINWLLRSMRLQTRERLLRGV
jgi:hypothetical protein